MARCITESIRMLPGDRELRYRRCRRNAHVLVSGRYPFCTHHTGTFIRDRRMFVIGNVEVQFITPEAEPDRLTIDVMEIPADYPEYDPAVLDTEAGVHGT